MHSMLFVFWCQTLLKFYSLKFSKWALHFIFNSFLKLLSVSLRKRTKSQNQKPNQRTRENQEPKTKSENQIREPKETKSENQKPNQRTKNQRTKSENQKPNQKAKTKSENQIREPNQKPNQKPENQKPNQRTKNPNQRTKSENQIREPKTKSENQITSMHGALLPLYCRHQNWHIYRAFLHSSYLNHSRRERKITICVVRLQMR